MTTNLIRTSALLLVMFVLLGCQCMEQAPEEDLQNPKEYISFILEGFKDFWNVLDESEQKGIDPSKWNSFDDMEKNFATNDINIEKEFITRTLMNDKAWNKYAEARSRYLKKNPGKTINDQITEIIKNNWINTKVVE